MNFSNAAPNVSDRTLSRKELGTYYTPRNLTTILSKWAIRSSSDQILEPSFGGCGFLESAVAQLSDLGCKTPSLQLFGCDIDVQAFQYLSQKLGTLNNITRRFIIADFLTLSPEHFEIQKFDAVIGNPPYIASHNLTDIQKNSVDIWCSRNKIKLNRRASLWAYFVLHSMSFLKLGGRMAWVLPVSFLLSNYGKELHSILKSHFGRVLAIRLGDRIFLTEGTEERTVLLLCSDYGQSTCILDSHFSKSIDDLSEKLESVNHLKDYRPTAYKNLISQRSDIVELGQLCNILIGTVTGANQFFIMTKSQAEERGLKSEYLRPILSKFSQVPGLLLSSDDVAEICENGKRCLLFSVSDEENVSDEALAYMATFPQELREKNSTFRRRQNRWLAADDGRIPDAFFSYMIHDGPRLAINNAKINSTNTIHRVYFLENMSLFTKKIAVISLCTTFSQLSAEIEGRSYGSGVLKIEPSEAKRIKLIIPNDRTEEEIETTFSEMDNCFRQGRALQAYKLADQFIFGISKGVNDQIIEPLNAELIDHRKQRQRSKF